MTIEIKVPQLPESVTDATLVGWHKKVGDTVRRDDNLVDLETDKVVLEVPATASGTLIEIKVSDGATVTSGELLTLLDDSAVPAAVEQQQADVPVQTAGYFFSASTAALAKNDINPRRTPCSFSNDSL